MMSGSRLCGRTRLTLSPSLLLGLSYIFIWISSFQQVAAEQRLDKAIVNAYGVKNPATFKFFCIPYNYDFHELPSDQKSAQFHPLMDMTPETGCTDIYAHMNISNTLVAVSRGDCSFAAKAALIAKNGGIGVLNVSPDNKTEIIPAGNTSDYNNINITVALIREMDFQSLKQLGENIMIKLFSPRPSLLDATEFVILFLAMSSIIIGSYWSGVAFYQETNMKKRDKVLKSDSQRDENGTAGGHKPLEDETKTETLQDQRQAKSVFPASIPVVILMVCIMSTFLLGLYFLYDYLVYVVIFMFTVTSSVAFYTCFKGVWNFLIPGDQRLQCLCMRCYRFDMRYKEIPFAMISISVGIIWFIYRHESFSWILQDFLGLLFCIHVLKNIRIPSLKAGTIFLCLAFVYDIFFVFITPFFTANGSSVMIDVATGGRSHHQNEQGPSSMPRSLSKPDSQTTVNPSRGVVEILPLVFRVPRFYMSPLSVCFVQESLLGFGDIILPGVLIVYNHIFDIYARTKKLYLCLSIIGYLVGLILAFVALAIMKVGQPALLYLVPCVLLFTTLPAWCRGELREMWTGEFLTLRSDPTPEVSEVTTDNVPETNEDPEQSNPNNQTNVTIGKEEDLLLAS